VQYVIRTKKEKKKKKSTHTHKKALKDECGKVNGGHITNGANTAVRDGVCFLGYL